MTSRRASALALVGLALWLNGIAALNAWRHHPSAGYDAFQHLAYAETLATGRLPTPADTHEFFSPPLPYLVPAGLLAAGLDLMAAAKGAQVANVLLSVALTLVLIATARLVDPAGRALAVGAVGMLGLFPVYFKTMALVRGEPYLAFFSLVAVFLTLRLGSVAKGSPRLALVTGLVLGLALLSRQWGFLLLPALAAFAAVIAWREAAARRALLRAALLALLAAVVVAGPFYLWLAREHGSVAAFNRPAAPLSAGTQPLGFYLGTGLPEVFTDPVHPSFPNRLLPIFYSEIWGDYWGAFLVYTKDARTGELFHGRALDTCLRLHEAPPWCETNRHAISAYLGRVSVVALLPFGVTLAGLALGLGSLRRFLAGDTAPARAGPALFVLVVLSSLAGYLAFLVRYPEPLRGDTIKATYMLQVFPCLALLAAGALNALREGHPAWFRAVVAALVAAGLHDLPACVSRMVR